MLIMLGKQNTLLGNLKKEGLMTSNNACISQRISKFGLGLILLGAAAGLGVLGLTLLPIIGFILAVPVAALAVYFFRIHLNKECEMDFSG